MHQQRPRPVGPRLWKIPADASPPATPSKAGLQRGVSRTAAMPATRPELLPAVDRPSGDQPTPAARRAAASRSSDGRSEPTADQPADQPAAVAPCPTSSQPSDGRACRPASADLLLERVVAAWPRLAPGIQAAILAMVQVAELTERPRE